MSTSTKATVPLVVVFALVGTGLLTACGGNSTAETTPSPSDSASREAGIITKPVRFNIANETGGYLDTNMRREASIVNDRQLSARTQSRNLAPGESTDFTGDDPRAEFRGKKQGTGDTISSDNAPIGAPAVIFLPKILGNNESDFALAESLSVNETYTWKSSSTGRTYVVTRKPDTTAKIFNIVVK